MHCTNCGTPLRVDDAFCPKCGQEVAAPGILEHGHFNPPHAPKRRRVLIILFLVLILPMVLLAIGQSMGWW